MTIIAASAAPPPPRCQAECRSTVYCPIALATALAMAHFSGRSIAGLVSPIDVRPPAWRHTIGWFSRVTPVRILLNPEQSATEATSNICRQLLESSENSLPLKVIHGEMVGELDRSRRWRPKVYLDVEYEDTSKTDHGFGSAQVMQLNDSGLDALRDGLAIVWTIYRSDIEVTMQYEAESLNADDAAQFIHTVANVLVVITDRPGVAIKDVLRSLSSNL